MNYFILHMKAEVLLYKFFSHVIAIRFVKCYVILSAVFAD